MDDVPACDQKASLCAAGNPKPQGGLVFSLGFSSGLRGLGLRGLGVEGFRG